MLGDSNSQGIISKILSDSDEPHLFHIDGDFPSWVSLPMSMLVDENEFINGSGRKDVPKHQTKFILEAETLDDVCPSFVARSVIIC